MTDIPNRVREELKKKTLDEWLDEVDYGDFDDYIPSEFALLFLSFIKLVNGKEGEQNKTPVVHLKMLDKLVSGNRRIANLCFRGAAKTTLFFEYLVLFIAVMKGIPGFGEISGMIYVSDSMDNGVKSARKNIEYRYYNSDFLRQYLPEDKVKFTDAYIEFTSADGHRLGVKMFGAKTGIRGTKIYGKRPTLAVLDDLVSDDDAKSKASMAAIKDTVYKGIDYALHPKDRMIVFNGTPFNLEDILIEAVESGAWDVNVWPVCERFPCEREDFKGAWEDRFDYDFVRDQYEMSVKTGKIEAFMQELMLRISSAENRLVQDHEILWYKRADLLDRRSNYNFYITTDFATSEKQSADDSVISVWAYDQTGNWFWVDGVAHKKSMDSTIDELFRLVRTYKPQQVGVEITGQQGGFVPWLRQEMMRRNTYFVFASSDEKNGTPGIRPTQNKLARFNMVVPWFKVQRMWFPEEMKATPIIGKFMTQLKLATSSGLKGKDDCIDTISMLAFLRPYAPTVDMTTPHSDTGSHGSVVFDPENYDSEDHGPLSRYV